MTDAKAGFATDDITVTSEITVTLVDSMGGDLSIVRAARASTLGVDAASDPDRESAKDQEGLINYLIKNRHGSPFEHSSLTFFVHAPAMVFWEWIRHRIGQSIDCETEQSFNLESGRYKRLDPVFWIPPRSRKMLPDEGHKAARPKFKEAGEMAHRATVLAMMRAYRAAWSEYLALIDAGIANEVARAVLGFGIYYSGWVTANPRSLMNFLSLRTHDPEAKFVSFPQVEIEEAARACERFLAEGWPITHSAFCRHGRIGP
jgi:thymidylate synthase (FAD)